MESIKVEYETAPGLSIGTMIFDLGWPWTVLHLDHRTELPHQISRIPWETMLDTIDVK